MVNTVQSNPHRLNPVPAVEGRTRPAVGPALTPIESLLQQPTPLERATGLNLSQLNISNSNTADVRPTPLLPNVTRAGQVEADSRWAPLRSPPPGAGDLAMFGDRRPQVESVLRDIQQDLAYNALGPQDKGPSGRDSLWSQGATGVANGRDARDLRQTTDLAGYALSPRRQTEDVPGKLLDVLSTSPAFNDKGFSRYNTLVIDTHRLNQFPEMYLPQVADAQRNGKQVMLVASIGGSTEPDNKTVGFDRERAVADRDLRMLDTSLKLLNAAGIERSQIQVVAGQADTPAKREQTPERTAFVNELRTDTARAYNQVMERNGLSDQKVSLTTGIPWGGDELASTAIARALPQRSVEVIALDKDGKQLDPGTVANYWENNDATSRLLHEAMDKNNLRQSKPGEAADMTLYVVVDKSNGQISYRGKPDSIRHRIEQDVADNRSKPGDTMIVDLRGNNGAFDSGILPRDQQGRVRTDLLAVGSWGTGANSLGQTLAIGKVFDAVYHPTAQRQMLIESVANDFVMRNHNGQASLKNGALNAAFSQAGIDMNPPNKSSWGWDQASSFQSIQQGQLAQQVVNRYVNTELDRLFGTSVGDVNTTFQFNRVFEAHFQLNGGPLPAHATRGLL